MAYDVRISFEDNIYYVINKCTCDAKDSPLYTYLLEAQPNQKLLTESDVMTVPTLAVNEATTLVAPSTSQGVTANSRVKSTEQPGSCNR